MLPFVLKSPQPEEEMEVKSGWSNDDGRGGCAIPILSESPD